jgi:hypothetical protein
LGDVYFWLDFRDTDTIFSDTAGLVPITDAGLIARVNNKGSQSARHWLQADSAQRPSWDEATLSADFTLGDDNIDMDAAFTATTGGWTVAYLGMTVDQDTNSIGYAAQFSGFTTMSMFIRGNPPGSFDLFRSYASGGFITPDVVPLIATPFSNITDSTGTAQNHYTSTTSTVGTQTRAHIEIQNGGQIGTNGPQSNGWGGKMGSVLIYNKVLDGGELAALQAWDTANWETVWA